MPEEPFSESDFLVLGMAFITRESLLNLHSTTGRQLNGFDITAKLLASLAAAMEANSYAQEKFPEDFEQGAQAQWGCFMAVPVEESDGTEFICWIGRETDPNSEPSEVHQTRVTVSQADVAVARSWFPWG